MMMDASSKITQLCESWRRELTSSSKQEQQRYAAQFLALLGWDPPVPFSPREEAQALGACPYILRTPGQAPVAAYFLMPGVLEAPAAIQEKGLDFCPATRRLVNEAREVKVGYALVSDLYRSYLYDVSTDELLAHAGSPVLFNDVLGEALSKEAMDRGSLEELRREPRSVVARQLREWRARWTASIVEAGSVPEETASVVLDRLAVVQYLFDHDIMRRTRRRLRERFMTLVEKASEPPFPGCGGALVKLFHDMWLDWRIDLFAADTALDQAIGQDHIACGLLREFSLLSRGKFSLATILESFNHGEPDEKMRVRMVPDVNEDRNAYLAKQTLETIDEARVELDLAEEGYRAIFHWLDQVIGLYDRLDMDFDAKAEREQAKPEDMDLFAWSAIDASRPSACTDKIAHACTQGFRIYYDSPRQRRVARLMVILHLIGCYEKTRRTVERFPDLSDVLVKRPLVMPSDRMLQSQTRGALFGGGDRRQG